MIIDPYVWYKTPILSVAHVATDTVAITVAKPDNYTYAAGQYALLQINPLGTEKYIRQYSFSSHPDGTKLEFLIRKLPGGKVSSWLHDQAHVGDLVAITKAYGKFEKAPNAKHHVLVAGGVGLAPFLSMVRTDPQKTSLVYSESTQDKVIGDSELTKLLGRDYHPVLSKNARRINATNFVNLQGEGYVYYICGSKQFLDSVESHLIDTVGITRDKIVREAFTLQ